MELQSVSNQIAQTKKQTVLAITGGGLGAFTELTQYGGASRFLVEGIINYAPESTHRLLGGKPDHYASAETAQKLAVAAYNRCASLIHDEKEAHGVAATAKLGLTHREEREGRKHEIHIAYHNWCETQVLSYEFLPGWTRREQEDTCRNLILHAMYKWYTYMECPHSVEIPDRGMMSFKRQAAPAIARVVLGEEDYHTIHFTSLLRKTEAQLRDSIVFPGSFNPMHEQHLRMAEITGEKMQRPVWLELSVTNTDKPQLDYISIMERIKQISAICMNSEWVVGLLITNAPLFMQKANILPLGVRYIVGANTYNRIGDWNYGDPNAVLKKLMEKKQGFLVFPRKGVKYRYPHAAMPISSFVSDYEDTGLSSSEIRNAVHQSRPDKGN